MKFSITRPYPISLWPCPASLNSHRAPSRARLLGWCQLQGTMASACVLNSYKLFLYTEVCSDASSPKSHCLFFLFFPCLFNSLGFDQCCFLLTASSKRSLGIQGHFPQRQAGCPKQLHKLVWIWISRKFCSLCWNWSICRCTAYQYSHLIVQC